jgi:FKBP-type peptidyl-prolyl cis-trans isomerase
MLMRILIIALVAAAAFAATGKTDDNKPSMPALDSKEWKKNTSGLEIWDVKEGKGAAAAAGAKVKVHYTGWLTNGEIFDSSVVRKEPIEFGLDGLIKGWQEGIPGMKIGGVRRLKIPPALAYGDKVKGSIPANSTLVFEIELLATEEKPMLPKLDAKEWKKLDSGLEVWDVKEGEGEAVKKGGTVTVHYTGWLTDGKQFDSSIGGKPITFPLSGVIKGWQEGIPGMKPGGTRRLKIPAELGYGKAGAGDDIPPNAVLVFEVQLIK